MNDIWTKMTVTAAVEHLDDVTAVMGMLDNGLMIEDYSDLTLEGMYGDLMDDALLHADRTRASVSLFVPAERSVSEYRAYIDARLSSLGIDYTLACDGVCEEDWANAWKQYYKPIKLSRITVVPAWEDYTPADGEITMQMDPGMAFGTGTHETTRLVMEHLCEEVCGGERVLDVGCGSGILSICASKLGAREVCAYDIDPVAVRVSRENAARDGVTNMTVGVSDLLLGVDKTKGLYDLCVANIVADIILRMAPDIGGYIRSGGRLIVSGIIGCRRDEVVAALTAKGFTYLSERTENDWYAILLERD